MKIKRRIKVFSVSLVMLVSLPFSALTASAASAAGHSNCVMPGSWYNGRQEDLLFYVRSNVISNTIPKETYNCITNWNGISSNVNIRLAYPADQAYLSQKNVIVRDDSMGSGNVGYTRFFNINGTEIKLTSSSSVVYNVEIDINMKEVEPLCKNDTLIAKKVIRHEVGHALMLNHPETNSSLNLHTNAGLPYSIMNQGEPNYSTVSSSATTHDINQIKYKWGT